MSFLKFKSLVLFIKIVAKLLLLRPFGYMYLKLIDIIDTNFVLVIHVLIVNPVFMAKVQTKLLRNTDFNTVFVAVYFIIA